MKIVTILGARPQFIKAAALSRLILEEGDVTEVIVHTGQHYDSNMSDIFFEQMRIPKPHHYLGVESSYHGQMTGRMLEQIEKVLMHEKPDMVVVYGDTNTTLAGSLAAKKMHIKIAHVEAGLRSFNMNMPEEVNRIVTDRLSDVLFCPSQAAIDNLHAEGFKLFQSAIHDVGDIMKDVAFYYKDKGVKPAFHIPEKFVLATLHRAENTDDSVRLLNILQSLQRISSNIPVVMPIHPRTKNQIQKINFKNGKNFIIQEPVGYLEMVHLLTNCQLVVTDSGGLQKEAFYFNKFCVTTRDETEWTELVNRGYNHLVGTDPNKIADSVNQLLKSPATFDRSLYGECDTADKILDILKKNGQK
jgi:UDP-GlcNAc3NAcA epimerase